MTKEELEELARDSANKESSLGNIETNEEWDAHRDGFIFGYQKAESQKSAIPIVRLSVPDDLDIEEMGKILIPEDLYKDCSVFPSTEDRNYLQRQLLIRGIKVGVKMVKGRNEA